MTSISMNPTVYGVHGLNAAEIRFGAQPVVSAQTLRFGSAPPADNQPPQKQQDTQLSKWLENMERVSLQRGDVLQKPQKWAQVGGVKLPEGQASVKVVLGQDEFTLTVKKNETIDKKFEETIKKGIDKVTGWFRKKKKPEDQVVEKRIVTGYECILQGTIKEKKKQHRFGFIKNLQSIIDLVGGNGKLLGKIPFLTKSVPYDVNVEFVLKIPSQQDVPASLSLRKTLPNKDSQKKFENFVKNLPAGKVSIDQELGLAETRDAKITERAKQFFSLLSTQAFSA